MVGHGGVEGDVEPLAGGDDLLAPVGMDFPGEIDVQMHFLLLPAQRRRLAPVAFSTFSITLRATASISSSVSDLPTG